MLRLEDVKLDDDPMVDASLKQASDVVLWLEGADMDITGEAKLWILKNKNGPVGVSVKLLWDGINFSSEDGTPIGEPLQSSLPR